MFVELQGDIINLRNVTSICAERRETPEKIIICLVNGGKFYKTLTPDELTDFKKKVLAFNTK